MDDREKIAAWERESERARAERANRRLWILCIILSVLLCASWVGFFIYESQYETVVEYQQDVEQEADGDGNNQYIGGDYYGDEAAGQDYGYKKTSP